MSSSKCTLVNAHNINNLLLPMFTLSRRTQSEDPQTDTTPKWWRDASSVWFSLCGIFMALLSLEDSGLSFAFFNMLFPNSSPFTQHKPHHVFLTNIVNQRLFILLQVCAPFAVTSPQKARCEEGWTPGSHNPVGPHWEKTYGVCVG